MLIQSLFTPLMFTNDSFYLLICINPITDNYTKSIKIKLLLIYHVVKKQGLSLK